MNVWLGRTSPSARGADGFGTDGFAATSVVPIFLKNGHFGLGASVEDAGRFFVADEVGS